MKTRKVMKSNFQSLFIVLMIALSIVSIFVVVNHSAAVSRPAPCSIAPLPKTTFEGAPSMLNCTVDGEHREALVYAPTFSIKGDKMPLVFAFHGHGGSMAEAEQKMHVQRAWPQAIVIYPQGLDRGRPHESECGNIDPVGNFSGWQVEANQPAGVGNKDLEFFDAMVETIRQKYNVDDDRVYSTGFSNGALFSYLLWAERGNTLAAIAEVSGRLWKTDELKERRPLLAIAGRTDTTDPTACQLASIEKAKEFDNANGTGDQCPAPTVVDPKAANPQCTLFPSSTQTPVKTLIHDGAHWYPSWAPEEIVKFFKNHKRS